VGKIFDKFVKIFAKFVLLCTRSTFHYIIYCVIVGVGGGLIISSILVRCVQ